MIVICAISQSSMPQYISTTLVRENKLESRYHHMQQHIPEENLAITYFREKELSNDGVHGTRMQHFGLLKVTTRHQSGEESYRTDIESRK